MQEIYRVKTSPVALSDNMIIGEKYRITVLTEALVRLESIWMMRVTGL